MLGLNEALYQMAMANSVCWHGYMLWIEDGQVFISALEFEVVGQWNKWRLKKI